MTLLIPLFSMREVNKKGTHKNIMNRRFFLKNLFLHSAITSLAAFFPRIAHAIIPFAFWNKQSPPGKTVLLLKGEGANGSTTITDSSPLANALSVNGNVQISTAAYKYGSASISFDGSGDYLVLNSGSVFNFTKDFTIEGWFYCINYRTTQNMFYNYILGMGTQSKPNLGASIIYNGNFNVWVASATESAGFSTTTAITTSVWHHFAMVRTGTTMRAFLDGVQIGTDQTFTGAISFSSAVIGGSSWFPSQESWNGYIDDFRVTQDKCYYKTNFTPPGSL